MERSIQWWIGDWVAYGERSYGETYTQAIEVTGQAYQTLNDVVWVARKFEFSRRRENLSWSHHREVAALEPPEQEGWLDLAERNEWSRNDLRRHVQQERRDLLVTGRAGDLPADVFQVIYADPPWRYEHPVTENRAIEEQYPTMALEDICALPVIQHVDNNSMLFLWSPSALLEQSFQVVKAWGFDYRSDMVWVKDRIGMGYFVRSQHEHLLIARRGNFPAPPPSARFSSVLESPREEHSRKPDRVYELIESMYPTASKCELFQRRPREGWTGWGNAIT